MKKVSFKEGKMYSHCEVKMFDEGFIDTHFSYDGDRNYFICEVSFTAEIAVKIVPYEQQ